MLDKFKEYLLINYNKPNTVNNYFRYIKTLYIFGKETITQDTVNKFFVMQNEKKISQNYKNLFINSLKVYNRFSNQNLELPKIKKGDVKLKNYIVFDQVKEITCLFEYIFQNPEEKTLIFEFMFFTGLRREEVCTLKKEDIDFDKEYIYVRDTKGKVDRFVPILSQELKNKLMEYVKLSDRETVFQTSLKNLNKMFNRIKEESHEKYCITPKTMRDSFAKYCLVKGIDLATIQKLLGHKNISTTQIYVNPDERMIVEACKKIKI